MDKLKIGKTYWKNGKEVTIKDFGLILIGNKKCDGVVYVLKQEATVVVEKKSDFLNSVIPAELSLEDRVVATCMGKILDTYKIHTLSQELTMGVGKSGNRINFYTKINPNGFVRLFEECKSSLPQTTEYIFVSPQLEKKLVIRKQINTILSIMGNMRSKLLSENIDYQNINVEEMQEFIKGIQKLEVQFNNKIKFLKNEQHG